MTIQRPGLDSIAELIGRSSLSRRSLAQGLAAFGGAAALGLGSAPAHAATTMTWMGWQGYETPITSGSFLKDNDIDFQPTFIASNEEIISKLQAGGIGKTDLVSMYFGYLRLMHDAGLIEPIDETQNYAVRQAHSRVHRQRGDSQRRQAARRAVELGFAAADVRSGRGSGRARKLDGHLQGRIQGQGRDGRRPAHLSADLGDRGHRAGPMARS